MNYCHYLFFAVYNHAPSSSPIITQVVVPMVYPVADEKQSQHLLFILENMS